MASRKASAAGQGNGLAAAGRDRAHLELAELGPLLEEKGDQGAASSASVSPPSPPEAPAPPSWDSPLRPYGLTGEFAPYPISSLKDAAAGWVLRGPGAVPRVVSAQRGREEPEAVRGRGSGWSRS